MRFSKLTLMLTLFAVLCSPSSFAGKKDNPMLLSRSANIRDVRLNLVPFITAGFVVGDAAEMIEFYSDDYFDRLLYGGGISFVYYPKPRYGIGLNLERAYKTIPVDGADAGRGWFYSGSFILNFRTSVKNTPYGRVDLGLVSAGYPDYTGDSDLELGTHTFVRVGIGIFSFTSVRTNTRAELYYIKAFSANYEVEEFGGSEIGFNASCFGVEVGVGIPLLTR